MGLNGTKVIIIEWHLVFFTLCLVVLRLYLSFYRHSRFKAADYFVLVGWLFFLAQASMDTAMYKIGYLDKWVYEYKPYTPDTGLATYEDTVKGVKLQFAENTTYYCAMYSIKFSMLVFYYNLFPTCLPKMRMALHIVTVITGISWVFTVCISLFGVQPIHLQWAVGPEHRWPSEWMFVVGALAHVGSDLAIYILPFPLLKKLHLPRAQKYGVAFTFALGFCCIIFSIFLFMSYLFHLTTALSTLCGVLEQTWAISVVCCPAFKTLVTGKAYDRIKDGFKRKRRQIMRADGSTGGSCVDTKTGITSGTMGTEKSMAVKDDEEVLVDGQKDLEVKLSV